MTVDILILVIMLIIFIFLLKRSKKNILQKRLDYIQRYSFPKRVEDAVLKAYPNLKAEQVSQVIDALREYFKIATIANGKMVSMPSQVVDVAWHEFLLFTKAYNNFCQKAFGKFFHHHPTEGMKSKTEAQRGIKLSWKIACKLENIDPKNPKSLPLLFAIDSLLNIPDGFKYSLNCKSQSNSFSSGCGGYCASDIGCSGGCGGSSDSSSWADSFSGDGSGCGGSSGDGGGCGGSSCGGGCGGS